MAQGQYIPEVAIHESVVAWAQRRYGPIRIVREWQLMGGRLRPDVAFWVGPPGFDNLYIVECKAKQADHHAVDQLRRYMDFMREQADPTHQIFGLLVAPSLSSKAELAPFMSFLSTAEL